MNHSYVSCFARFMIADVFSLQIFLRVLLDSPFAARSRLTPWSSCCNRCVEVAGQGKVHFGDCPWNSRVVGRLCCFVSRSCVWCSRRLLGKPCFVPLPHWSLWAGGKALCTWAEHLVELWGRQVDSRSTVRGLSPNTDHATFWLLRNLARPWHLH